MTVLYVIGATVTFGLFVYLFVALLRPDLF